MESRDEDDIPPEEEKKHKEHSSEQIPEIIESRRSREAERSIHGENEQGGELEKTSQQIDENAIKLVQDPNSDTKMETGLNRKDSIPTQHKPMSRPTYDESVIDVLDTIDPEVSTLTTLTNVQNSLFLPDLGRFINRRPRYEIRPRPSTVVEEDQDPQHGSLPNIGELEAKISSSIGRTDTFDSHLSETRYAVLPHGVNLEGWTQEEKQELNDWVRHYLHSKRSAFKRRVSGALKFLSRPLGFFIVVYLLLITIFGVAFVLFLIGWINLGSRRLEVINIVEYILVGLTSLTGDGLAPFRAIDTYHMIFIAYYHYHTWHRRRKAALPELQDPNDLPTTTTLADIDAESWNREFTVLTPKQQATLEHHQMKFAKSHTFYRPHETETHYAFPMRLVVVIVVLLDVQSLLQIALGACTYGIPYKVRPFVLTTVLSALSTACNVTAFTLLFLGDRKTRKKDVKERLFRQELTENAMRMVGSRRNREHSNVYREI